MTRRGRRTREQLANVPTSGMTPAEYERSDTPGTYVIKTDGARYTVSGLHSAKAVQAKTGGTIERQ